MSDLDKLEPTAQEIKDEVAVRMAAEVFVWDGKTGAFLDTGKFVAFKKKWDCEVKTVNGAEIAVISKMVERPDWEAVAQEREKLSGPLKMYYAQVARFRRVDHSIMKLRLLNYYELGRFVKELVEAPDKYGNKSVETLAATLKVSDGALYQCQRCYERYEEQRVKALAEAEMPWRVVTKLLSVQSTEARTKIEDSYLKEKLDERQLAAAIKKARKEEMSRRSERGESVDRRGGKGLKGLFESVAQLCDRTQEKLAEFSEGYKAYAKLPQEKKSKELADSLKTAESGIVKLYKRLSKHVVTKPKEAGGMPADETKKEA